MLAKDCEFVKGCIGGGIERNMAADALVKPAFEVEAGPFYIDGTSNQSVMFPVFCSAWANYGETSTLGGNNVTI